MSILIVDYVARTKSGEEIPRSATFTLPGLTRIVNVGLDNEVSLKSASDEQLTEEIKRRLEGRPS